MKRIFLISFSFFILCSFYSVCYAEDWQWVSSNSAFTIWIKPSSIRINRDSDDQSKVYGGSAWVKLTYDPAAVANMPIDGVVVDGLYTMAYIHCDFREDILERQEFLLYNGNGTVVKRINRASFSKFYTSIYQKAYYYILNAATGLDLQKITNGHTLHGGSTYFDKNGKKWRYGAYVPSIHYDNDNNIIFASCDQGYTPDNSEIDVIYRKFHSYQPQNNTIARKGFYAMDLKAVQYGQYEAIVPDSILEHIVNWVKPYCEHTDSNWLDRKKNGFIRDIRRPAPSQSATVSDSTSAQLSPLLPYHKSSQT